MKKAKNIIVLFLISLLVSFSFFTQMTSADSYWGMQSGMNEIGSAFGSTKDSVQDIRVTIVVIINVILSLLGVIAVVLVVYAGFLWMTSGGNEDQVTKAKTLLKNAIIGLIIILMAWSMTSFILRRILVVSTTGIMPWNW